MIKPTLGRIVWLRPNDPSYDVNKRHAAIVAQVNDDGTVNLGVFNDYGVHENAQNITLVQDEDVPKCGQCEWMPYQKGQAAKYDSTTDDLMARMIRLEELLSDLAGLEPPSLLLVDVPDNETEIGAAGAGDVDPVLEKLAENDKTNLIDTTAEVLADEDLQSGETKGPETGAIGDVADSTDESADTTASTDDGASAETTEAGGVGEEVTESAALMGLKAHAAEVELANIGFLDEKGEPCDEGTMIHEVEYTFIDRVSFVVTFDEYASLVEFKFKVVKAAEAAAES